MDKELKLGDRVRVVRYHEKEPQWIGKEGIVTFVPGDGMKGYYYRVEVEGYISPQFRTGFGPSRSGLPCEREELELIEEESNG